MIRKTGLLAVLIVLVLACACKTSKRAANPEPYQETLTDLSHKKVIKDKELYLATTEVIPIDTVYLNKDTLHILTQKIQACDADNFSLMWNGMMMKSLPPQTNLKLFLLNEGTCKEMHKFHLTFNVHNVRVKSDSTNNGSTIIRLGNWRNTVTYEY